MERPAPPSRWRGRRAERAIAGGGHRQQRSGRHLRELITLTAATSARTSRWAREPVQLAAAILVGLVLRWPGLGDGLSHDEAYTWEAFASRSWTTVATHYPVPNNHILHSLLVKASAAAFGQSEPALRLPALVAGLASIPATWWLAAALPAAPVAGVSAAVLAAWVVALNPTHVDYSHLARGYTLLVLWSALAGGALLRAQVRRRRSLWPVYAAALFLAGYTQPSAVLLGLGLGAWSLVTAVLAGRGESELATGTRGHAPGGGPGREGARARLVQASLAAHGAVAAAGWLAYGPIAGRVVAAGRRWGVDLLAGGAGALGSLVVHIALLMGLGTVAFAALGARSLRGGITGLPAVLLTVVGASLLVPMLYGTAPPPRGYLFLLPWVAAVAAAGVGSVPGGGSSRRVAAGLLLLSLALPSAYAAATHDPDPGWRDLGTRLEARTPRDEILVAPFGLDVEIQHYARKAIERGVVTTLMDGRSRSLLLAAQAPRFDLAAYTLVEDATGRRRTLALPAAAFDPIYRAGSRRVYRLQARAQSMLPERWQWNAHPDEVSRIEFGASPPAVSQRPGLAVRNAGGRPFRIFSQARFRPPGPGLVLLAAARTDPLAQISLYRAAPDSQVAGGGPQGGEEMVEELNLLLTAAKPVEAVGLDGRRWYLEAFLLPVSGTAEYGVYARGTAAPRQDFADIRVFFYPLE